MHGAGNDYIYVDTAQYPISHPEELARAWSAPHTGIGSDGLVLIGSSDKADFSMRIFNADGSEARMCGNASRCIGKYLFDYGLTSKTEIALDTLSGIRMLNLHLADGKVNSVTVDMGIPADEPAHYETEEPKGECVIVIAGKPVEEIREEEIRAWEEMPIEEHMEHYLSQGMDKKEAMKAVAKDRGISKRDVYQQLL